MKWDAARSLRILEEVDELQLPLSPASVLELSWGFNPASFLARAASTSMKSMTSLQVSRSQLSSTATWLRRWWSSLIHQTKPFNLQTRLQPRRCGCLHGCFGRFERVTKTEETSFSQKHFTEFQNAGEAFGDNPVGLAHAPTHLTEAITKVFFVLGHVQFWLCMMRMSLIASLFQFFSFPRDSSECKL